MELIVYNDDNYATWWINRKLSKKIASFLKKKGFIEYNAVDLARWMEKIIEENTSHQSVVVFSQDVIPDSICHTPSPSSLIRSYLDSGGKVVWIGDNPFYYQGVNPSKVRGLSKEKIEKIPTLLLDHDGKLVIQWGLGGAYGILGVVPVFMHSPSEKVKITKDGTSFGIQNRWYGNRPIIKKGASLRKSKLTVLGTSKPIYPISTKKILLQKTEERGISLPNFMNFLSKFLGFIPTVTSVATALIAFLAGLTTVIISASIAFAIFSAIAYITYWYFWSRETFASAWLKNFNDHYSDSGFFRLWDFEPSKISDVMLQDLYMVAISQNRT